MEFIAIELQEEDQSGGVRRVVLLPENYHLVHKQTKTDKILTAELLQGMTEASEKQRMNEPAKEVLFDFNHNTLKKDATPEQKVAAGWIERFEYVAGLGLTALTRFTKRALEMIEAKEFRFVSPVFRVPVTKLSAIVQSTLTNEPHIKFQVDPILAAEKGLIQQEDGSHKQKKGRSEAMKSIAEKLGLAPEASEASMLKAIAKLTAKPDVDLVAVCEAIGVDDGTSLEDIRQIVTDGSTATEKIAALQKEAADKKVEDALTTAQREGKISKADRKEWKENLESTSKMFVVLEKLPVLYDIGDEKGTKLSKEAAGDEPEWVIAEKAAWDRGVWVAKDGDKAAPRDVERVDLMIAAEKLMREDPSLPIYDAMLAAEAADPKLAMYTDSPKEVYHG